METNIVTDITNPMSVKILIIESWAEMLSANQIAGFLKM